MVVEESRTKAFSTSLGRVPLPCPQGALGIPSATGLGEGFLLLGVSRMKEQVAFLGTLRRNFPCWASLVFNRNHNGHHNRNKQLKSCAPKSWHLEHSMPKETARACRTCQSTPKPPTLALPSHNPNSAWFPFSTPFLPTLPPYLCSIISPPSSLFPHHLLSSLFTFQLSTVQGEKQTKQKT